MTDVSARNRVQAGVPTGGQFATEAKGENGDLDVTAISAAERDERNAAIQDMVERYVEAGLLKPLPAMNGGGTRYQSEELLLGRDGKGARVYAQVALEWDDRDHTTTDLEKIGGCWNFSAMGTYAEKGERREDASGGQIHGRFADEPGDLGEFSRMWKQNHLNTTNAGTEVQKIQSDQIQAECMKTSSWGGEPYLDGQKYHDRCFAEIEPDRGYKWGHSWLVRELDPAEVEETLGLFAKLAGEAR